MRVRLLTSFAGKFAGADNPGEGEEIEVPDELGEEMVTDGRAEEVGPPARRRRETTARQGAPERAVVEAKAADEE